MLLEFNDLQTSVYQPPLFLGPCQPAYVQWLDVHEQSHSPQAAGLEGDP